MATREDILSFISLLDRSNNKNNFAFFLTSELNRVEGGGRFSNRISGTPDGLEPTPVIYNASYIFLILKCFCNF